jgi:hypothetical protein
VAGGRDLPFWLRRAELPLHERDVRILVGRPGRTLKLIDEVERAGGASLRDLWPSLRGYIHIGEPFEPYRDTYRRRLGDDVCVVPGEPDAGDYKLNDFGERLAEDFVDSAVRLAAEACASPVRSYEIEPEYPTPRESRGRHVFHVKFEKLPDDLQQFAQHLDDALGQDHDYSDARAAMREPLVRLPV